MSETITFFNDLFGGYREMGFLELRSLTPRPDGSKISCANFYEDMDELYVRLTPPGNADLYFGVLPRSRKASFKSAVTQARVLWADIDAKDKSKDECIQALYTGSVPAPSYIVDSGGGIHAYWLLDDTIEPARAEDINYGLARWTGGDYCHNADRILRVPGTFNFKNPESPRPVSIIGGHRLRYPAEAFTRYEQVGYEHRMNAFTFGEIIPEAVTEEQLKAVLPDFLIQYVHEGIAADIHDTFRGDRSRLDFYIISKLLRNGFTSEQVAGILTDPAYAISQKTMSRTGRSRKNYLSKSIGKAQSLLAEEHSEGVTV